MPGRLRVAALYGGRSVEHEVSLLSARSILNAIDREKYEVVLIGIDKEGNWFLDDESRPSLVGAPAALTEANSQGREVTIVPVARENRLVRLDRRQDLGTLDVVFPVLHGPYGEDGSVQGLLKLANIAYVGADVLGSAVGMDKDVMKRLLRDAHIAIAPFVAVRRRTVTARVLDAVTAELGFPLFVKPANLGSSVGVSKAMDRAGLDAAVEEAFRYDTKAVVEAYVPGREIECSVLGNHDPVASVPGEVIPAADFYSYDAKYVDENGARLVIPADVDAATEKVIRTTAVESFRALCCMGMARVDMFLRPDGAVVVNEINTIPGFTRISMYPKLWEASGLPFKHLITRLIELGIERFEEERNLRTSYF